MKIAIIPVLFLPSLALAQGAADWGYTGEKGPDHWAMLAADYQTCAAGTMQSPIDLKAANAAGDLQLDLAYDAVPLKVLNTGLTLQLNGQAGGGFTEAGEQFDLVQGHFHTPSEHVLDGKTYPAELHLVHKSADGKLAVLGILIEEGAENAGLAALPAEFPKGGEEAAVEGASFEPAKFLPEDRAIYRYSGSLTTPPCSEGVAWHVVKQPVTASAEQIAALTKAMGENARPPQELHGRLLVEPAE